MKTPRGIRNNNPGNLDKGSPWQGLVANPDEPRFCTFKDPVWGDSCAGGDSNYLPR